MKNGVKLVGRFLRNMVGTVGAISLVSVSAYFVCKALNWIAGKVVFWIDVAIEFLKVHWIAAIVGVVVLTLGSMIFEGAMKRIRIRKANRNNDN